MPVRNVLVLALEPVAEEEIRKAIEIRREVEEVAVLVVAPALGVSALQSLTGAVDEARAEAEARADRLARATGQEARTEIGDSDPLVAVEDALREFPAQEIVVAGAANGELQAGLSRFGVPVARVDGARKSGDDVGDAEPLAREVARGQATRTPAVLLAGVGGIVLAAIVLVSLLAFLVIWLA